MLEMVRCFLSCEAVSEKLEQDWGPFVRIALPGPSL